MNADFQEANWVWTLEDELELRSLINTYSKTVDAFDWEGWASTFTEDAVFVMIGSFGTLRGRQQILEGCKSQMDAAFAVQHHMIVNLDVKFTGPDTATGTTNVLYTGCPDDGKRFRYYQIGGRHVWTFVRTDDGWRISEGSFEVIWDNGSDEEDVFADQSNG